MKDKVDISQLIQNSNHVYNKIDKINIHINLMFNEIHEIKNAVYIFQTIEIEWNRRKEIGETINYSAIRTILFESIPYKINLGLAKIFSGHKEFSLLKTINIISQMDEYKNNIDMKNIIKKIHEYLETSEMVKIITTYRDQFFAHLDEICILSNCKIDSTVAMKGIDIYEIDEVARLIGELYEVCFKQNLKNPFKKLSEKDIIYTFFWMLDTKEE